MPPNVRRVDDTIIGRVRTRIARSWLRHRWRRIVCALRGHDWHRWQTDDYDGPMDGEIPLLSRPAKPCEFGTRTCSRRCGVWEVRYPIADAPLAWRGARG